MEELKKNKRDTSNEYLGILNNALWEYRQKKTGALIISPIKNKKISLSYHLNVYPFTLRSAFLSTSPLHIEKDILDETKGELDKYHLPPLFHILDYAQVKVLHHTHGEMSIEYNFSPSELKFAYPSFYFRIHSRIYQKVLFLSYYFYNPNKKSLLFELVNKWKGSLQDNESWGLSQYQMPDSFLHFPKRYQLLYRNWCQFYQNVDQHMSWPYFVHTSDNKSNVFNFREDEHCFFKQNHSMYYTDSNCQNKKLFWDKNYHRFVLIMKNNLLYVPPGKKYQEYHFVYQVY